MISSNLLLSSLFILFCIVDDVRAQAVLTQISKNSSVVSQTTKSLDVNELEDETRQSASSSSLPMLRVKRPLGSNYTRKYGERIRLECEFEYVAGDSQSPRIINPTDLSLYWVKNYQEMLHTKKGFVLVVKRNFTSILILKNLEEFDSGSYMCIAELATHDSQLLNASSETTLLVQQQQYSANKKPSQYYTRKGSKGRQHDDSDYESGRHNNNEDDEEEENLADEFPMLNPTIVESYDEKGFCEPYRGSICAGIINANYSIYSTSSQQQDQIEERLRQIIPGLMAQKNGDGVGSSPPLSKRCSTFAIPSLCLFAFPLCDKQTKQPRQICRLDCKQLQQDICKNEYFNVKSLFEVSKLDQSSSSSSVSGANNNFILDCNQLPPSSDSPSDCVPIVTMTLDKLESTIIELNQKQQQQNQHKLNDNINCQIGNGVNYRGQQSVTRNGYTCQRWSDQYPHRHSFKPIDDSLDYNYCRNWDNDVEPWCFTTNPNKRKDYCYVAKCNGQDPQDSISVDSTTSGGVGGDKRVQNFILYIVPIICIPFFLFCIIFTYCYCRNKTVVSSVSGKPPLTNMSANTIESKCHAMGGSVASSSANIHSNKVNKMSTGSLANSNNKQSLAGRKNGARGTGSSKSSVISGSTANNHNHHHGGASEINPFLKHNNNNNYDQYYHQQQHQQQFMQNMLPPMPMLSQQNGFLSSMNGMSLAAPAMPLPPPPLPASTMPNNNNNNVGQEFIPLRQVSSENIRLVQEIGKGRFGSVYIGDLLPDSIMTGPFTSMPSIPIKVTVKTFDRKLFAAKIKDKQQQLQQQNLIQATSTPNVNNLKAAAATAAAANLIDDQCIDALPTAEEHFMEQEFFNEISLYSNLRHKHLANLIGINTKNASSALSTRDMMNEHSEYEEDDEDDMSIPKCMIFEHTNGCDLFEFLMQRHSQQIQLLNGGGGNHIHQIYGSQSNLSAVSSSIGGVSSSNSAQLVKQQQRNIADFVYIGQQIASGMEYLASQNFTHKDLAARNILMSDTMQAKISLDMVAQYKEQYSRDYYKFQMKQLPVRWMAPEALLYGRYSQYSDVWSYGVCLWEMFSYGQQPYAGCTNPEAIEMIRDRQLLGTPDDCPQRVYALMLECWNEQPQQRPSFSDIANRLRNWENYSFYSGLAPSATAVPTTIQTSSQMQAASNALISMQQNQPLMMTTSYSSNSQTSSKASSSQLGCGGGATTISTGIGSSSISLMPPPPPPPPIHHHHPQTLLTQYHQNGAITTTATTANGFYYSPSKFNKNSPPASTITTTSDASCQQFNRFNMDPMSSLRMSQRGGGAKNSAFPSNLMYNNAAAAAAGNNIPL